MEISFIVTSYKFEKYIVQCIESIVSQDIRVDYEILIRDDHSGDDTNSLLRKRFDSLENIKIIESENNIGAFENVKLLVSLAKGKYIAHIDGDDYFTGETRIMEQYEFLEANPEFSMICSGYKTIDDHGNLSVHHHPLKDEVDQTDLIDNNWVTFGRMWRNTREEIPQWLSKMPYLDWVFNYHIAKNGKIKCDYDEGGVYRISNDGMFSKKPKSDKRINYVSTREALSNLYDLDNKVITIMDCFIRNQEIENKLIDSLRRARTLNNDILLISNTPASKEVIELSDFFVYDKRNQLFQKEYENIDYVDFYISVGDFTIHNVVKGMQRHGLSVLVNLYNSVSYAKTLGYKYFQRIECDDIFGKTSLARIKELQEECVALNKKGLFYINDKEANISFHYFFCEIDHFLDCMPRISNESEYDDYINSRLPYPKFMIAEEFIYENVIRLIDRIHIKDGSNMTLDFPDTEWNTETSDSNMSFEYGGCISGIYSSDRGDLVCSYNYSTEERKRRIQVINDLGEVSEITHHLGTRGGWGYHQFPNIKEILVYDDFSGNLLYSQKREDSRSYINFNNVE